MEYDPIDVPALDRADRTGRGRRGVRLTANGRAAPAGASVLAPRRKPFPQPAHRVSSTTRRSRTWRRVTRCSAPTYSAHSSFARKASASSRSSPRRSAFASFGSTRYRSPTTAARMTRGRRSRGATGFIAIRVLLAASRARLNHVRVHSVSVAPGRRSTLDFENPSDLKAFWYARMLLRGACATTNQTRSERPGSLFERPRSPLPGSAKGSWGRTRSGGPNAHVEAGRPDQSVRSRSTGHVV